MKNAYFVWYSQNYRTDYRSGYFVVRVIERSAPYDFIQTANELAEGSECVWMLPPTREELAE